MLHLTFRSQLRAAMKRRTPQIPCDTCDGRGTVDLDGVLAETLAMFLKRSTRLTAHDIAPQLKGEVKTTAVNNRLEKLRILGFLHREKCGRFQVYFRSTMPG